MSSDAPAPTPSSGSSGSSSSSALSREIGGLRAPRGAFRLTPPQWATVPGAEQQRLHCEVYEVEGRIEQTLHLGSGGERVHSFGRNAEWCGQVLPRHASISRQHAALLHTAVGPVLVDLYSSHGSTLNGVRLAPGRPYALRDGDVARFGTAPSLYKFKLTGLARRAQGEEAKIEPIGPPPPTGAAVREESAQAGDKRRREDSGRGDESRRSAQPSGLADPKTGRIRCRHLLVKHRESRRPSSWREERIVLSREAAREKLSGLRAQLEPLLAGERAKLDEQFQALAKVHSDCSSAKHGGDLGFFVYAKMQAAFSKAAFQLRVGELSPIADTDSGLHIILRIE